MTRMGLALLVLALAGCGSTPPPDWALNAQGAQERATEAYLAGNSRVALAEYQRARRETARTGEPARLARVALLRCAAEVASLVFNDCPDYQALAADAAAPEQAYARYLMATVEAADVAQLPDAQRPVARALLAGSAPPGLPPDAAPLTRLVAAGVLLRAGRASPTVVAQAVDTASAQGWSRPLLAWLEVQARVAEQAGDRAGAERARRRAALVVGP